MLTALGIESGPVYHSHCIYPLQYHHSLLHRCLKMVSIFWSELNFHGAAACCGMLRHASKPPPTGPKIRCCGMLRHSAACFNRWCLLLPHPLPHPAWQPSCSCSSKHEAEHGPMVPSIRRVADLRAEWLHQPCLLGDRMFGEGGAKTGTGGEWSKKDAWRMPGALILPLEAMWLSGHSTIPLISRYRDRAPGRAQLRIVGCPR